jgi:hypothetical protein
MRKQKVLDRMVANITIIQSPINYLMKYGSINVIVHNVFTVNLNEYFGNEILTAVTIMTTPLGSNVL